MAPPPPRRRIGTLDIVFPDEAVFNTFTPPTTTSPSICHRCQPAAERISSHAIFDHFRKKWAELRLPISTTRCHINRVVYDQSGNFPCPRIRRYPSNPSRGAHPLTT